MRNKNTYILYDFPGPCDAPGADCGEFGDCNDDRCAPKKTCICKHGYTGKHCEISKVY